MCRYAFAPFIALIDRAFVTNVSIEPASTGIYRQTHSGSLGPLHPSARSLTSTTACPTESTHRKLIEIPPPAEFGSNAPSLKLRESSMFDGKPINVSAVLDRSS